MVVINIILLILLTVLVLWFSYSMADLWSYMKALEERICFETEKRRELELRIKELENDQKG